MYKCKVLYYSLTSCADSLQNASIFKICKFIFIELLPSCAEMLFVVKADKSGEKEEMCAVAGSYDTFPPNRELPCLGSAAAERHGLNMHPKMLQTPRLHEHINY